MKILIVDDHELFAEGLKLLLDSIDASLEVDFVTEFDQAHDYPHRDLVQLLLLDFNLVDRGGTAAVSALRLRFPTARLIVVSSEDSSQVIQACIKHGASGFIPKSSSRQILISALELVLNGGVYLPVEAITSPSGSNSEPDYKDIVSLTNRQRAVLDLALLGMSNKVIALELGIAEGTVKAHLSTAYKTLGVNNRVEAVNAMAQIL